MKKILASLLICTAAGAATANEYGFYDIDEDIVDAGATCPACPVCDCGGVAARRDNYVGVRVYKNEHSAYSYDLGAGQKHKYKNDNFGFGTTVGNQLTDYLRVEYETLYMGDDYNKNDTSFNYNIWANMLNAYLLREFDGAVAPYVGAGLGLTGIWGEINGHLDNAFDLSYQAMVGVLFRLNDRIDVDVGFKYVNFGKVEHDHGVTRVDATQLYLGGVYKFGL